MNIDMIARHARNAVMGAALVCALATAAAAKGASEDATSFLVNPAHDGNVDFAAGFSAPLVKAWTYDTGGTVSYPLIAHGALYVVSNGNNVFAINLADGKKLWQHQLGSGINLGAYDGGRLFYWSGSQLVALKAKNGNQLWPAGDAAVTAPIADNSTAPIAVDGAVYFGAFGVSAFDEKTGALKWSHTIDATDSQVAFGDKGVYAGGPTQYYKFATKDGTLLWQDSGCCEGGGGIAVTYFDKRAYLVDWSAGDFVLDAKDGSTAGSFAGAVPPTFFSIGKRNFALEISSGKLFCLDVKTGNVAWTFAGADPSVQPLIINGQPVVSVGTSVAMLDGATGAQLWTGNVGSQILSMNAGDGTLAVTTGSKVTAYVPQ